MFGGRYSHTRYSLRGEAETEFIITAFFIENINSMVSFGLDSPVGADFRERITSEATLTRGFLLGNEFYEEIHAAAALNADHEITQGFHEAVNADVHIGSNLEITREFVEETGASVFLGKNTEIAEVFRENVGAEAFLGKDTEIAEDFRESALAIVRADIIDKDTLSVSVTLPPGAELRIDSERFTVALNGVNIIHMHTGDWIRLNRNALEMTVSTGSNGVLDGTLMYTERYL